MSIKDEYLIPHGIFGEKSFKDHCASLPEFYFKPEVPEDVKLNFEVIKKLLVYSYFEYKFIDEAFSKCLRTLEMAMRIRTKELNIFRSKDTFGPLLKKLTERNLFDHDFKKMDFIREVRNLDAHPERHTIAGIVQWNRIEFFSFLINELYENIEQRLDRKEKFKNLEDKLQELSLENNIVIVIDGKPTILYHFGLLYLNNKYSTPTYTFSCTPLFDLTIDNNSSIKVPQSFVAKLVDLKIDTDSISGTSFKNRKKVEIVPLKNFPELEKTCKRWNSEFDRCDKFLKFRFESSIAFAYPSYINQEIREFQKMQ